MSTQEPRKLNRQHPDYPRFRAEIDDARKAFEKASEEAESKYPHPLSQTDAWRLARDLDPARLKFDADVRGIIDKYPQLYE